VSSYSGPKLPEGLRGADDLPNLFADLKRRGYGPGDFEKIAHDNVLRVWTAVETLASF
jgi:microsomal dipeptidase-like Zn-dependent dipeptidase